jgi:hypothetical protein
MNMDNYDTAAISNLSDAIPERLAKEAPNYLVEYGIRFDDAAMVFHFFPPMHRQDWDPEWKMNERLERAIAETFDTDLVSADYADEVRSFCVIVRGLGCAPDPFPLVELFFERIDSPAAS